MARALLGQQSLVFSLLIVQLFHHILSLSFIAIDSDILVVAWQRLQALHGGQVRCLLRGRSSQRGQTHFARLEVLSGRLFRRRIDAHSSDG